MKNAFVAICAALFSASVFAGSPVKINTGKNLCKQIFKESVNIQLECVWTDAVYDYASPLQDELKDDYNYVINDCAANFIKGFNENSKGAKMQKTEDSAKYKLVIKITNMSSSISVRPFYAGWEAHVWGTLELSSMESGDVLIQADIEEAEDGCDTERRGCYGETFEELGETVAKLK